MGLDINVLGKPADGQEDRFAALWAVLQAHAQGRPLPEGPFVQEKRGFPGLGKAQRTLDYHGAVAAFQEIAIPAYVTLGAPVVGKDAPADVWVRKMFAEGAIKVETEAKALERMAGYYALEAMDDCDGFPIYSNGGAYGGVDRTSFRGDFLKDCTDVIDQSLIEQAWVPMMAKEFMVWGQQLQDAAETYANANGLAAVLGQKRQAFDDLTSPAAQVHIVDQAAGWVQFWAKRGHGSEPYF